MDNKVAIVTGATSGIGEAVAHTLAGLKHTVVLTGRNRRKLEEMERAMASAGQRVVAVAGDITREEEARFVATEALKTFGAVQVLVHCAGLFRLSPAESSPAGLFKELLDTNLTSLQFLLKALLPHFYREGHGHVVALSSIAARVGFANETAYCASKWGLMGYLESLRLEGEERGLRVTAILPGPTVTPAWDTFPGRLPVERMLSPQTVASAVAFAVGQPENACIRELLIMPARDPFGGKGT
jgi:NADP-dependent 3-hydroxy acid dehydrogenase YdfG